MSQSQRFVNIKEFLVTGYARESTNTIIPLDVVTIISLYIGDIVFNIYNSKFKKTFSSAIRFWINQTAYFFLNSNRRTLFCKGFNYWGQLGIGEALGDGSSHKINTIHPFFGNKKKMKFISNGLSNCHVFVYTLNNKLYAMGDNNCGQMGCKTNTPKNFSPILVNYEFKNLLIDIKCGGDHTLFLTDIGTVYSCGDNDYNQLGHELKKKYLIKQINDIKNIKIIQCGQWHSYCLNSNGFLYTFGSNEYGQLCVSQKESNTNIVNKIKNYKFQFISSGHSHGIGLSLNNNCNIYGWGNNSCGQCGIGSLQCNKIFGCKKIKFNKEIDSVKCGQDHNIIRTNDNCYYTFGSNEYGECLLFTREQKIVSPTLISLTLLENEIKTGPIVDILPGCDVSFLVVTEKMFQ